MLSESGRLEKRTRVAMPVKLLILQSPGIVEKAKTENVSAHGARVVTTHPLPHQPLLLTSSEGKVQTYAHVVYCQRLADQSYAVGLQFESEA